MTDLILAVMAQAPNSNTQTLKHSTPQHLNISTSQLKQHAQPVFYYNTLREGQMLSFLLHLVSYSVVLGYGRHANNPKVADGRIGNPFVSRKGEVVDIGTRGLVPPPVPHPRGAPS